MSREGALKKTGSNRDVELCHFEIQAVLRKYNCHIYNTEGWGGCYIEDQDNNETTGIENP